MKKYFNNKHLNKVLLVIIGICLFAGGGVVALTLYADDIIYNPSNSEFKVNDAQGALDELYNMVGQCESSNETIILYFGGREIVANETVYGSSGGQWMGSVSLGGGPVKVVENINPKIFASVRYTGEYWAGSASGNYPSSGISSGANTVYFVDRVTGETVISNNNYGRPFTNTIDLSGLKNPVDMYWKGSLVTTSYGDATGACTLSIVYLKVRDDYQG